MIRALLIAEAASPELVSVPLEGWSHSRAIAGLPEVEAHVVTQVRNREAFLGAGLEEGRDFTAIDSEAVARPLWKASELVRGGSGKGWTTVSLFRTLAYLGFERLLWKALGPRIRAGAFDVVHRLTPLSPTAPSRILARACRRAGVPFVLGPLNGGLPWPEGFDQERRREREWLSYVRGAYKLLPGYRSTRRAASALIVGSEATLGLEPAWVRPKCVYIPENAIDPTRFSRRVERAPASPLRLVFIGRLVPYKGLDMLLEAARPLLAAGAVVLDVIGDGPELGRAQALAQGLPEGAVTFAGWVEHARVQDRLIEADVLAFPSIREFGGAVVLEAMALGLAPLVVDYGGPGELVTPTTGYTVPIGSRASIVAALRRTLESIAEDPEEVRRVGDRARERVFKQFTWDAKARMVLEVYRWLLGQRAQPALRELVSQE